MNHEWTILCWFVLLWPQAEHAYGLDLSALAGWLDTFIPPPGRALDVEFCSQTLSHPKHVGSRPRPAQPHVRVLTAHP